jgi:aspartyl-tRNA synthetase
MVAGFDRYFQIVKCFRDEDLRADRQPEFTQIDVEMSFVDEEDIYSITEGLIARFMKEIKGVDVPRPFRRLTYAEAMEHYGSDKPDLRFGLEFTDVTSIVASTSFKVFSENIARGGVVAGFVVPGGGTLTRNQLDNVVEYTKKLGAGGLIYARVTDTGVECPIEKFVGSATLLAVARAMKAQAGDLFFLISDVWHKTYTILGDLRLEMADRLNLLSNGKDDFKFLWVTDFPLLEFSEEEKRYVAVHHPFTSPRHDDEHLLDTEPGKARARAYDLVLNGNEIAGGSIRIYDRGLQSKMFSLLGINEEEAYRKFGFLLDAFKYGAPPHGGIAFGFDRIAMILAGQKSIRDVIAFPKTSSGTSLMDECPSEVDHKQLLELHIRIT